MANLVRERLHGNVTYFNVNRHINPTDVCVASCRLCAFGKRAKDPRAYTMSLEQVWETAGRGSSEAVTEFHIVGGLHPELTLDWYCEMFRGLKQRFPRVHLKALTMVEIAYLAQRSQDHLRGGARAADRRGRRFAARRRRRDLLRARAAHHLRPQDRRRRVDRGGPHGPPAGPARATAPCSTATSRTNEDRVDHLLKLRALQDETGGFQTFIPLAFHPDNTPLQHVPKTTGFDDLKNIAVARLLLDNIPHIKAYWVMMTPRDRAGRAALRRRRRRRHHGRGEDLPRRRRHHRRSRCGAASCCA